MDIGDRIRERRVALGMTQTELARRLHISRNQVSSLETGRSHPSGRVFAALENGLETSFTELLADSPSPCLVWLNRHEAAERREPGLPVGVYEQALATNSVLRLSPVRVRLDPRSRWEPGDNIVRCGEHFVYALEGVVEGLVDGRWFRLEARHGVYVHGPQPLVWRNPGPEPTEFLWIGGE